MTSLHDLLTFYPSLTDLFLQDNDICVLPEEWMFPALQNLDLASNKVAEIQRLSIQSAVS